MKKMLALLLVLCMLPAAALSELAPYGTFPITDTPEELSIFTTITAVQESYDTCYQTKFYEDMTGVHVKWLTYNNNEIASQFNLSLGSGEYPDIYNLFFNTDAMTTGTWYQMAQDGVIIPLDDLIEETVYIKAYLEANPDVKKACTSPDGHIYVLPQVRTEEPEITAPFKMWVYKDWMDAYCQATGKGVPATTDEYKEMLIYFRDNDMNGNGDPSDEIPLTGTYSRWETGNDPLFYFMNSFCYCPVTFIDADENNQIYTMVDTDAFREGLKYIHSLYEEKLLDEGCYVQELTQFRALTSVSKDSVTVGTASAGYPMRLLTQGSGVTWEDYANLLPLKGPEGVQLSAGRYVNSITLTTAITSACKNPGLAMRWLDYWFSEPGMGWYLYGGVEGTDWEWSNEPSVGGSEKSIKRLTNRENETWLSYARPVFTTRESWENMAAAEIPNSTYLTGLLRYELYKPYVQFTNLPQVVWCSDEEIIEEYEELETLLINEYIMGSCTKFITGALDINDDAAWADYLKGLEDRGMSHYLELCQQYYFGE